MNYSRIDKMVREMRMDHSLTVAAQMREIPISIVVGQDCGGKAAIMAHTSLALALRCLGGSVGIYLSERNQPGLPWMKGGLAEQLLEEAARLGMMGRLQIYEGAPSHGPVLALGTSLKGAYTGDAAGWIAAIGQTFDHPTPAAAPASILATCCSFAKLFKAEILGDKRTSEETWTFSLLDLSVDSSVPVNFSAPDLDLGHIGLLGAGAIGSGFAYNLWLSGWAARIDVIDRDQYDEPNLETTMLISRDDVLLMRPKAEALANLLSRHPRIKTTGIVTNVTGNSPVLQQRRDFFICGVDNPETRRELDLANSLVILNGGVGGTSLDSGHILCSRHGPSDPVLSSLYPPRRHEDVPIALQAPPPAEVSDECSRVAYGSVSMAAPFIGLATGSLLAANCASHVLGIRADTNYVKIDLFGLQGKIQRVLRK